MKKIPIVTAAILASIIILSVIYLIPPISFSPSNSGRAEGAQSLLIYFKEDYYNFNYTLSIENLTKNGYKAIVCDGQNESYDWCIQIEWPIPDSEYAQKYVSLLTVTFYGYKPENNTTKSHVVVGFGSPIVVDGSEKKERDKELARQAAEELAKIVGVSLDWERHVYTIAWMTMTSEGYYEEK